MTNIQLIKELRELTGAGIVDCKKALVETNGNLQDAVSLLRKKGAATAAKKSDRDTVDGLIAVSISDNKGAIIELNSETDFVARNEKFQNLASNIANLALTCSNLEQLCKSKMPSNFSVEDELSEHIAAIGENLSLRRMSVLEVGSGIISSYVHNKVGEGLGKIAVLVAIESDADKKDLEQLGKQIAMHIAATKPQAISVNDLDPKLIQNEREIFFEQSRNSGKPDNIIEKMVEGRLRKFYEEVVLLEQVFVIDNKTKIRDVIASKAKELGHELKIANIVKYERGEAI